MPSQHVDSLDLASEIDLEKMERIMNTAPDHKVEVIYSPYILLVWLDRAGITRIKFFERSAPADMKLAEEILNKCKVLHQNLDVRFPFAMVTWKE